MTTTGKQGMQGLNHTKPAAGRILISEPFTHDFFFGRSVVLLAEHADEGSFGVVINKPTKIKVKDVFPDLSGFDDYLFVGGPVSRENIFFIHTLGDSVPGTLPLPGHFCWGGDLGRIKHLITAGIAQPQNLRFFTGYSGWASKQLDQELQRHSWLVSNADKEVLMNRDPEKIWQNCVLKAGKKFSVWINYPLRPDMN